MKSRTRIEGCQPSTSLLVACYNPHFVFVRFEGAVVPVVTRWITPYSSSGPERVLGGKRVPHVGPDLDLVGAGFGGRGERK